MTTKPLPSAGPFCVLLVEDDDGDALLVQELLEEADERFRFLRARSVGEASSLLAAGGVHCALLDLGLPDASGLEAVEIVAWGHPGLPIIVLTGVGDSSLGLAAVAVGAQDYLVKGEVAGQLLGRAIRYAVQRKMVDDSARQLREEQQRRAENARLARGLIPQLVIADGSLAWATRYRPSGVEALLGGDFYDAVELDDGTVRAIVGDVCGHGPEEAALGVAMRVGWRALVLGDCAEDDVLPALHALLKRERHEENMFTTMCELTVSTDRTRLRLRLAGHPPPLLVHPEVRLVEGTRPGLPLGLDENGGWHTLELELGSPWSILLYSDGVFEGRTAGGERLGLPRFLALVADAAARTSDLAAFLDRIVADVEAHHGGPLPDDIALLCLAHGLGAT